ncbi:MAG: radical SAM protein, partial [Flavobacteriia bacterium]|nr:radical SAM protein [Flavobacteriia bacterium]
MAGIYIHVPFCRKKCSYCDFHFSTTFHSYRERLLKTMVRELRERLSELEDPVKTIYFGGGTPSLLSKKELQGFLDVFNPHTLVEEITLEVNPEDLTHDNLTDWESLGINRLSIGIQSLNETLLHW